MEEKRKEEVVLEVRDLKVSFNGRPILRGVNLSLHRGETVVVLGGSGCGKSTLFRTIIGVQEADSGDVLVLGRSFAQLTPLELDQQRTRVAMLFQSSALFNSLTVGENIAVVLREHTPLNEEEIELLVKMKLEMVGLRHAEQLFPSEVSGGMKKRIALARALALNPVLMLYDEPGAGLDPVTLACVDRLISTLGRALNMASLVVTHELTSVDRIADRVIFLHQGRVLADLPPGKLREVPDAMIQQFLSGSVDGPLSEQGVDDGFRLALLGSEAP